MQLFVPYVYVPSAEASYVKLVTPLGELHMEKDVAWKALVSVAVLLVTLALYKLCFSSSGKRKKGKKAKEPKLQKRGDVKEQEDEGEEEEESSEEEEESGDDDDGRSALDESILKKGEHSYYYAHQRRVVKDTKDENEIKKTMVSTYGWVDNKNTVSIYLRDDAVVGMQDDQLILNWTKTSFSLDLLTAPKGDQAKSLMIPTLYSGIKDVAWKVKKNQLTLTLTKEKIMPWKSLNGAAKNMEEHIEYDQSLYE